MDDPVFHTLDRARASVYAAGPIDPERALAASYIVDHRALDKYYLGEATDVLVALALTVAPKRHARSIIKAGSRIYAAAAASPRVHDRLRLLEETYRLRPPADDNERRTGQFQLARTATRVAGAVTAVVVLTIGTVVRHLPGRLFTAVARGLVAILIGRDIKGLAAERRARAVLAEATTTEWWGQFCEDLERRRSEAASALAMLDKEFSLLAALKPAGTSSAAG